MTTKNTNIKQSLEQKLKNVNSNPLASNMSQYIADAEEDLGAVGYIDTHDYHQDVNDATIEAEELLQNLIDLYLKEVPTLKEIPYIKSRIKEDAHYYAQMKVLQSFSQRMLMKQMSKVDAGEDSPKMFDTITKQISEMRDNIKDGRSARLEVEKLYKELRKDFGLANEIQNDEVEVTAKIDGNVISNEDLNEQIERAIANRSESNKNIK